MAIPVRFSIGITAMRDFIPAGGMPAACGETLYGAAAHPEKNTPTRKPMRKYLFPE
jgi:hypothetical protein